jgi:hypothetical protein
LIPIVSQSCENLKPEMRPVRLGNDPKQGVWISSPGDNDLGSDRNTGRGCSKTPGGPPGSRSRHLGVFPECPGTSLNVQICWPEGVEGPPTSADVLSCFNSWLDSWLDPDSFQGVNRCWNQRAIGCPCGNSHSLVSSCQVHTAGGGGARTAWWASSTLVFQRVLIKSSNRRTYVGPTMH